MDCFVPTVSMCGFRSSPLERLVVILPESCSGCTSWEVYRGSCAKRRQGGSGFGQRPAASRRKRPFVAVLVCCCVLVRVAHGKASLFYFQELLLWQAPPSLVELYPGSFFPSHTPI